MLFKGKSDGIVSLMKNFNTIGSFLFSLLTGSVQHSPAEIDGCNPFAGGIEIEILSCLDPNLENIFSLQKVKNHSPPSGKCNFSQGTVP